MRILSIETSCDETAAAVTEGRKVLSSSVYSQILLHKKWGGVVPSIAKKAHQERIDFVIEEALKKAASHSGRSPDVMSGRLIESNLRSYRSFHSLQDDKEFRNWYLRSSDLTGGKSGRTPNSAQIMASMSSTDRRETLDRTLQMLKRRMENIDFIAVTYGPGLAIALEVGIDKAKELAKKYNKKIIPVNHMEGHIYSCFAQNSMGNPVRPFEFPYIALLVSGGHTEIVLWEDYLKFKLLGATVDDAAGEALDKASKILGLGYPGGPVIERIAQKVENRDFFKFPRPMRRSKDLNLSFSGLKTSFYYLIKDMDEKQKIARLNDLVSSFQEAVFESIIIKLKKAIDLTGVKNITVGGGVVANKRFRNLLRGVAKEFKGTVVFPPYKYLCTDNAAMIGVAAYYKAKQGIFVKDLKTFERHPRLSL